MLKICKVLSLSIVLIGAPVSTCLVFTSCKSDDGSYSLYYRDLAKYKKQNIGLDISLFEVDFASSVLTYPDLKTKLDTLNNGVPATNTLDYIGDRTFSFAGDTGNGWSIGTGWIISRETKSIDDYRYWIMTNRHVTNEWKSNNDIYTSVKWNSIYSYDTPGPWQPFDEKNYHDFLPNTVKKAPESVAAINLNGENQLITPFCDRIQTQMIPITSAGYPFDDDGKHDKQCRWNFENNSNISNYFLSDGSPLLADQNTGLYVLENSYLFPKNTFSTMVHGASGSLVIDDTTKSVVGIYWGGPYDKEGSFWPAAVIFNTTGHDGNPWDLEYNKLDVISTIVGAKVY